MLALNNCVANIKIGNTFTHDTCMLMQVVDPVQIARVVGLPFTSCNIHVPVIQNSATRHSCWRNACIQLLPIKLFWIDQDLQQIHVCKKGTIVSLG